MFCWALLNVRRASQKFSSLPVISRSLNIGMSQRAHDRRKRNRLASCGLIASQLDNQPGAVVPFLRTKKKSLVGHHPIFSLTEDLRTTRVLRTDDWTKPPQVCEFPWQAKEAQEERGQMARPCSVSRTLASQPQTQELPATGRT